jgi:hypothetical protein
MNEKPKQETIQKEIEREDTKFLKGGLILVIILFLLFLIGGYIFIRAIILPTASRLFNTFNAPPAASPSSTANPDPTAVLKTIDAVPLHWIHVESEEVGVTVNHPEGAIITKESDSMTIDVPQAKITLIRKDMTSSDLEDVATQRKNNVDEDHSGTVSTMKETEVAAIPSHTFTAKNGQTTQYIFIEAPENDYVEIVVIRKTDVEEDAVVIEDILASIEFISSDEVMSKPDVVE